MPGFHTAFLYTESSVSFDRRSTAPAMAYQLYFANGTTDGHDNSGESVRYDVKSLHHLSHIGTALGGFQ